MERVVKILLKGTVAFLCIAASFYIGVGMTVVRGYGTDIQFVPATCWAANIMVVNRTGQSIDALIIREGENVFWRGAVSAGEGGCVLRPSRYHGPASVEAILKDGTRLTQAVEAGFFANSYWFVNLFLIEPTGILHVTYRGEVNGPIGEWNEFRSVTNLLRDLHQ